MKADSECTLSFYRLHNNLRYREIKPKLIFREMQIVTYKTRVNVSVFSAVGVATGSGWTTKGSEFEFRQGQEFLLLHIVQTGFVVHPTSSPMDTGGTFREGKAAWA
jgi:hypothetical protein